MVGEQQTGREAQREFVIELLLGVSAPTLAAADRLAEDARKVVLRTNVRIRDGRINNVIVADVRGDDD